MVMEGDEITKKSGKKYWFGQTREDAMSAYRAVVSHGYALKCNYAVTISPYKEDGLLVVESKKRNVSILSKYQGSRDAIEGLSSIPIWLLATEVDCPILNGEVESAKVGHSQIHRLTGDTNPEIPITFLETGNADILHCLETMQRAAFNFDGTQNPPAEYAVWLTIEMFDRHDVDTTIWGKTFLAALQTVGNVSLSSSDHTPLTTTATFVQLNPYRRG